MDVLHQKKLEPDSKLDMCKVSLPILAIKKSANKVSVTGISPISKEFTASISGAVIVSVPE